MNSFGTTTTTYNIVFMKQYDVIKEKKHLFFETTFVVVVNFGSRGGAKMVEE